MIKFDENNVGMEPIKAGEYEVYANAFDIGFSQAGNERVQFNYFIREDVQQPSQGSEIRFDNFTNTPNAAWRMNSLMKAIGGLQNGAEFPDLLTWAKTMLGRPLRVKVDMEANDSGKEYPKVKQLKQSQFPQMQQQAIIKMDQKQQSRANQFNQPYQSSFNQSNNNQAPNNNFDEGRPINISEDDLPF